MDVRQAEMILLCQMCLNDSKLVIGCQPVDKRTPEALLVDIAHRMPRGHSDCISGVADYVGVDVQATYR